MKTKCFGYHLIIDAINCNKTLLNDKEKIKEFLLKLVDTAKMRLIDEPKIYEIKNDTPKDKGGITGGVFIMESHINIHTFAESGDVSFDMYSCKQFNKQEVLYFFKYFFGINKEDMKVKFFNRGQNFKCINKIDLSNAIPV